MNAAQRTELFRRLQGANPAPKTELEYASNFQLLIAVILSAQATDKSVNLATRRLFADAPTPQAMLALGEAGLTTYIDRIGLYRAKANLMMDCMRKYLPEGVTFTPTEGGMFLWATLPDSITSVDLYRAALAKGVAICPGDPFYEIDRGVHTVRLNYSNSTDEIIEKGMKLLGEACAELLGK